MINELERMRKEPVVAWDASSVPDLQYRRKPRKTAIRAASAEFEPEARVLTTRTCYSHTFVQTVLHTKQATPVHHQNFKLHLSL